MSETTRLSRLWYLFLLGLATWSVTYARFILGPLQEAVRVDLGLSDNQIAWLQGPAVAVPMAIAAIPIGILVDRYSRTRLLYIFTVVNLVSAVWTASADNLIELFAARCLSGLSMAAVLVASYSMVGDLYAPAQRGRATSVVGMGEVTSPPAVFALGGLLLVAAGPDVGSWRSALGGMCVPLLPAVFLLLLLREPRRIGVIERRLAWAEIWSDLWRYRRVVLPLLLARIMVWVAVGAVLVWTAPSFARRLHLSPDRIGAIMAAVLLVSSLLGPILGGLLADICQRKGGPRQTMIALTGLTFLSVFMSFFAVAPNVLLACILLGSLLTLDFTVLTAAMALGTVVMPGELRGLFVAVSLTAATLFSDGVAPLVVSSLSGELGGATAIGEALALVCGITGVLGAIVFGLSRNSFANPEVERVLEHSKLDI
ncbi:MFS transporter [Peristeroidobacter agariperforans]|uniref:MFS transporter n=1 Tax=Peristeroidobacter agariperforans TaxID=268404 RepID=UPI00101CBA64|nr:MFS transporter [Peristeroidobacter agariperforans]